MNIGIRLAMCFSILMIFMIGLSGVSLNTVNGARENLSTINDVNSVKQRHAINYRGSVHDRAIAIRDVVLLDTEAERQEQATLIETLAKTYTENETALDLLLDDASVSTFDEIEIDARIDDVQARTNPIVENIIRLMNEGERDLAHTLLLEEAAPLFSEWLGVINEYIDLQEARNQTIGASVTETVEAYASMAVAILVAALALALIAAVFTTRSITVPLRSLGDILFEMTEGQSEIDDKLLARKDEVGGLAHKITALNTSIETKNQSEAAHRNETSRQVSFVVDRLSDGISRLSNGDLNFKISEPFADQYEQLRTDFNSLVARLASTMASVIEISSSIRSGSAESAQASNNLSHRTENQAATLEETAGALDTITTSIKSAADGIKNVERITLDAREQAETSGKIIKTGVAAMNAISNSSTQISTIIGVIDDIAFQTNLLSLNAGVEAARAGEAGRGFAVVASEVRALAQRSSEAAKEIRNLIDESSQHVAEGVNLVDQTGQSLGQIIEQVNHISELVTKIAESSIEQSSSLTEINTSVYQLDQVTQKNTAMVEETTAAALVFQRDAKTLSDTVAFFNTETVVAFERAS